MKIAEVPQQPGGGGRLAHVRMAQEDKHMSLSYIPSKSSYRRRYVGWLRVLLRWVCQVPLRFYEVTITTTLTTMTVAWVGEVQGRGLKTLVLLLTPWLITPNPAQNSLPQHAARCVDVLNVSWNS